MQLEYKEILKLKGRRLVDTRNDKEHIVTSATKSKITLDNGIKILTTIFYEHSQQFYELIDEIKIIEHADISAEENLFYEHKGDVVCLHDDVKGELGWFKVWYDSEMDDREYITLNESILYLDEIDQL